MEVGRLCNTSLPSREEDMLDLKISFQNAGLKFQLDLNTIQQYQWEIHNTKPIRQVLMTYLLKLA